MRITVGLLLVFAVRHGLAQTGSNETGDEPVPTGLPPLIIPTETENYAEPPSSEGGSVETQIPSESPLPEETPVATDGTGDVISSSPAAGETGSASSDLEPTVIVDGSSSVIDATPTTGSGSGGAATTMTSASPTSTAEPAAVDLESAEPGENAEVGWVNGQPAVVMSPPAGGSASFSVTGSAPEGLSDGGNVQISATVLLGGTSWARRSLGRRQSETPCSLQISVDGVEAYNNPVSGSIGSEVKVTSNSVSGSSDPKVDMTQTCEDLPVTFSVYDVKVNVENSVNGGGGGGGGGGGAGDDTSGDSDPSGTDSGSDSGGDSTETSPSGSATAGGDEGDLAGSLFQGSKMGSVLIPFFVALFA